MSRNLILQKIAYFIRNNTFDIAIEILDNLYKNYSEYLKQYEIDKNKLFELIQIDLSKMFSSLITDRKDIFLKYVIWEKELFMNRLVPIHIIKGNLITLKNVLINKLYNNEEKEIINEYIEYSLTKLEEKIESPVKFIDTAENIDKYIKLLLSYQKSRFIEEIKKIITLENFTNVISEIIEPIMYKTGDLWLDGTISVSDEHYITSSIYDLLNYIYPLTEKIEKKDKLVVTTCLPNEFHELGIKLVSLTFLTKGWNNIHLGQNTPEYEILKVTDINKPDILAISSTVPLKLPILRDVIEKIKVSNKKTKIMVGGYVFRENENLYKAVGADLFARNIEELVSIIDNL